MQSSRGHSPFAVARASKVARGAVLLVKSPGWERANWFAQMKARQPNYGIIRWTDRNCSEFPRRAHACAKPWGYSDMNLVREGSGRGNRCHWSFTRCAPTVERVQLAGSSIRQDWLNERAGSNADLTVHAVVGKPLSFGGAGADPATRILTWLRRI